MMHTGDGIRHPNQVRLACERCRRQKIRCSRQAANDGPCTRCARLNLPCLSGTQRRLGRPPRTHNGDSPAAAAAAPETGGSDLVPLSLNKHTTTGTPLLNNFMGDSAILEWVVPAMPPSAPRMPDWSDAVTPADGSLPLLPEAHAMSMIRSSDTHFRQLSKINVDLHRVWDNMTRNGRTMSFEDFMTPLPGDEVDGLENLHVIMNSAQDLLSTLKELHFKIGIRPMQPEATSESSPPSDAPSLVPDHAPTCADSSASTSPQVSSSSAESSNPPSMERSLDSPTAFLVISSFALLVKTLEVAFTVTLSRLSTPSAKPLPLMAEMRFGKMMLSEFSTYGILHCELLLHLMRQINILLGFPSRLSSRSMWTGLLSTRRYRTMVNDELGGVEGGAWSTRPSKLVESIIKAKELMHDMSIMGYF